MTYQLNYKTLLNLANYEILNDVDFELIIYDEVEKFQDYNKTEPSKYNYPFERRKTILSSFSFYLEDTETFEVDSYDSQF